MNAVIIDSRGWALGLILAQLNVCNDLLDDRSRVGTTLESSVLLSFSWNKKYCRPTVIEIKNRMWALWGFICTLVFCTFEELGNVV